MIDNFVKWLKNDGWRVCEYDNRLKLDELKDVLSKYNFVDEAYLKFLTIIKRAVNEAENMWFICYDEFIGNSDIAFKWNEFENISLEAAEEDISWQEDIRLFWENHLPIIMSVADSYSYYAINLNGEIVFGMEPEFEEVKKIANTFEEFINMIMNRKILL